MNLYTLLKEDSILNEFKDRITEKVHYSQNLIDTYLLVDDTDEEYLETLSKLYNVLDELSLDFKNVGYDYDPEVVPDVEEGVFRNTLSKFKEQLSYMLNHFSEDLFTSVSTEIRYTMNLIDVHKTNFIKI
jgi:hypothetical protein